MTGASIMRSLWIIILILLFFLGIAMAQSKMLFFDIPVKKIYAEPNFNSNIIYEIPIEVRALGVSEDRNWYKVIISFDLVFLGKYEYTGWCYIPLADIFSKEAQ